MAEKPIRRPRASAGEAAPQPQREYHLPTGPMHVVALPPCPICGLPLGTHHPVEPGGWPGSGPCPPSVAASTGGPEAWLPSEGTLLKLLKRHYGWLQPEAHRLERVKR